jgi:hypothetical protein
MKRAIHTLNLIAPSRDACLLALKVLFISSILFILNSSFGVSQVSAAAMAPLIPSFVTKASVATGRAYEWRTMAIGEHIYVDRSYAFTVVPAKYLGLRFLQTANNDKHLGDNDFITFNATQEVVVYVIYANASMRDRPSWLAGWEVTGDHIVTTDRDFSVLAKRFPAGTVSLGGNEQGASMYSVLLRARDGSLLNHQMPFDEFGLPMLYPTKRRTPSWSVLSWQENNSGMSGSTGSGSHDASGWSMKRDSGEIYIDGEGLMVLSGSAPRFYVQGNAGASPAEQVFWKNVEITLYYKRISDDGEPYAGLSIGTRTGPHVGCTATTYYAILRNDGDITFVKELEHPISGGLHGKPVWNGNPLPHNQWIGMKFVIYNINDEGHVKLEAYLDRTGGVDGGTWEKVFEYIDDGGWTVPHNCPGRAPDHIITEGGGRILLRNDRVEEALYKWFSVREIAVMPSP